MQKPPANASVYLSLFSNSIRKISAVDASFVFDAVLSMAWQDTRWNASAFLDFAFANYGDDTGSYDTVVGYGGFQPALEFGNAVTLTAGSPSSAPLFMQQGAPDWAGVSDGSSAWIVGEVRTSGTFLQPQSLRDFPFDSQTASIVLQSSKWSSSTLGLSFAPNATTVFNPRSDIDGWEKQGTTLTLGTQSSRTAIARASFSLSLKRNPAFYVTRFVQPLCLVLTMAIASVG